VFTTFTAKVWDLIPNDLSDIRSLIENGYQSLLHERQLFQTNASDRKISLPPTTSPNPIPENEVNVSFSSLQPYFHPSCYEYAEWMISCCSTNKNISFANILLLLWGIEKCYYEAFMYIKKSEAYNTPAFATSYRKFVEWWTADEFGKYIDELEEGFYVAGGGKEGWDEGQGREVLKIMLEHEANFWASAFS
jgi:hypothetical protein